MVNELYSYKKYNIEINVAEIGISKSEIHCVNYDDPKDEVLKRMKEKRFDVLPIKEPNKNNSNIIIKNYYKTNEWGDFSDITKYPITYNDLISVNTDIKDLVKSFIAEKRNFFFISKDLNVVGLITISDLNHPQFKTYLFSLLIELEIILLNLIKEIYLEEELKSRDYGEDGKKIKERFELAKKKDVDVHFAEYLYLSHLIELIEKNSNLNMKLGYIDKEFEEFKNLASLRNKIAHPGHRLVTSSSSIKTLNKRISLIKESIFRLKN